MVRRVFPYHIVLCVNRPCSERAAVRLIDYVTQIAFQNNFDQPEFVPSHKQALIPPNPSQSFDESKSMLDGLLVRFFEDETAREVLDSFHPLYIPRDIITPHLFSLQLIKQLQKLHPKNSAQIVLKNGRVILSTAGPLMTNYCALMSSCVPELNNKKINWVFGSYFSGVQPKTRFDQNKQFANEAFK